MPTYEYEARNRQGAVLKGKIDALDEKTVISILRQKEYYPVSIRIYKETSNISLKNYKKVTIKDISIFCRQFSFIISSGISILRALEIVKGQTDNPKLKSIILEVYEEVQKGKTLSQAMEIHKEIPEMLVNMIEVGESSGTLDRIMGRMAAYYDKEYRQNQKIRQALTYPAVVSVFAVLVVIVLVVKVLPTFVDMIMQSGGGELPLPTRIVLGISNAIRTKGLLILLSIILISVLISIYSKTDGAKLRFDKIKMDIPVFGKIYKKIITARFARTFGTLMASGVALIESITICSNVVGNKVIKNVLLSLIDEVKKGLSLGEGLEAREIFPPMLTQMIKIGEESGTLDEILEKTAEFYDGEVETVTAQLTTMIEPIIIILLAVVVGFIILSIILPMFQMYSTVGM